MLDSKNYKAYDHQTYGLVIRELGQISHDRNNHHLAVVGAIMGKRTFWLMSQELKTKIFFHFILWKFPT